MHFHDDGTFKVQLLREREMLCGKRLEFMVALLERFAKDYNSSLFAILMGHCTLFNLNTTVFMGRREHIYIVSSPESDRVLHELVEHTTLAIAMGLCE